MDVTNANMLWVRSWQSESDNHVNLVGQVTAAELDGTDGTYVDDAYHNIDHDNTTDDDTGHQADDSADGDTDDETYVYLLCSRCDLLTLENSARGIRQGPQDREYSAVFFWICQVRRSCDIS